MGYTHYINFNKPKRKDSKLVEKQYQKAIKKCQLFCVRYNNVVRHFGLPWQRLSGYSAHTKPGLYGGLNINGRTGYDCESLILREHYIQNNIGFIKTAHQPYDMAVVACLSILKHYLGDFIEITSDGFECNWTKGVDLVNILIGIKVINPIGDSHD